MGNLYKRDDGTYYADYYDRSGKRQRRSTRTKDPQVARARLRELELQAMPVVYLPIAPMRPR